MSPLLQRITTALLVLLVAACAGPATKPAPIQDQTINLAGQCAQREADGFREQASLTIRNNQVQALDWQIWVGNQGSCSFKLSHFKQTKSHPHIELIAQDNSGCKLMVWQEPRRITLAHANCERACTGDVYAQAWPVMFEPRDGSCAQRN